MPKFTRSSLIVHKYVVASQCNGPIFHVDKLLIPCKFKALLPLHQPHCHEILNSLRIGSELGRNNGLNFRLYPNNRIKLNITFARGNFSAVRISILEIIDQWIVFCVFTFYISFTGWWMGVFRPENMLNFYFYMFPIPTFMNNFLINNWWIKAPVST